MPQDRMHWPEPPPSMNGFGQWVRWTLAVQEDRLDHQEKRIVRLERNTPQAMALRLAARSWPNVSGAILIILLERMISGSWAGAADVVKRILIGGG